MLQLLLASLATSTHGQGQEVELVPGSYNEVLSPSLPFHRIPLWNLVFPGSPGSSLVVLFSTVAPSSDPLLCGLTLWKTVSQVALILWFFHPSWLDSLEVLSVELLSLGVRPSGWFSLPEMQATTLCQSPITDDTVL